MADGKILKRKITEELNDYLDSGEKECPVIKGARQVGKSFAIRDVLASRFGSLLEIDFNLRPDMKSLFDGGLDVDSIIRRMKVSFPGTDIVPGKTAIFLDEIQACPNARASLKSFSSDGRYTVVASGSLLGLDYADVPSYPVGYEHVMVMRSLDFEEFLWAIGIDDDTIRYVRGCISSKKPLDEVILRSMDDYYRTFIAVGGMPEAVKSYLKNKEVGDARMMQNDIVAGYRNDIGKYSKERERNRIFACFDSIPSQLSKENKKYIYAQVDDKASSGRKYRSSVDWIENAGIGVLCRNVSEPKMPLEEREDDSCYKLYMSDTGLLLSMMSDDVAHAVVKGDIRVNKGALTENAVAEGLTKCGFDLHYFAAKNLEIDFIVPMRGQVVAAEVKSGNNRRSKTLVSIKDNHGVKRRMKFENTNIVVTDDGVEHYPLFASAFADSMYDPYDLKMETADADEVNQRAKEMLG